MNKDLQKKIYRIIYGKSVYYKSTKRGRDWHISVPMSKTQANKKLNELNSKYDYTTVSKLEKGKWRDII